MAVRKPVTRVKSPGIFTRFRLNLRKKLTHSPAKRAEYQRRLDKVQQEVKAAKKAA